MNSLEMDNQDHTDLIEAYLDNTLPEEKRKEVEQRIEADKAFRQEVKLHQHLREQLSDPDRWKIFAALEEASKDPSPLSEEPTRPKFINKKNIHWLLIGLIAVLAVIGFFTWQWLNPNPSEQEPVEQTEPATLTDSLEEKKEPIVQESQENQLEEPTTQPSPPNVQPEEIAPISNTEELAYLSIAETKLNAYHSELTRGAQESKVPQSNKFSLVQSAMEEKDFQGAKRLLDEILEDDPKNGNALKRLAYVNFKIGDYKAAIDAYEKYSPSAPSKDEAEWILTLYLLADFQNNEPEFKKLFFKILSDRDHPYHSQAEALFQELTDAKVLKNN